jgi:pentapeptide repeat protein
MCVGIFINSGYRSSIFCDFGLKGVPSALNVGLSYVNLSKANFINTNLMEANISHAFLEGSNFSKAKLSNTIIATDLAEALQYRPKIMVG